MTETQRAAMNQALSIINGMEQNHGNLWQVNASPEELDALCESLRAALAEPEPDPVSRNGWFLREVLFDDGEPISHRDPKKYPLTRENAMLIVEQKPDAMKEIRLTEAAHGIGTDK